MDIHKNEEIPQHRNRLPGKVKHNKTSAAHCNTKYSIFTFNHQLYLIQRRASNNYNKLSLRVEHSILQFSHAILTHHHLYMIWRYTTNIMTYTALAEIPSLKVCFRSLATSSPILNTSHKKLL